MVDPGARAPIGLALSGSDARVSDPVARADRGVGRVSVLCAVGMLVATVAGSLIAGTSGRVIAVPLAILALAFSAAAILLGSVAARRRSTRLAGIVGLALGILLNPVLLAQLMPGAA